MAQVIFFYKMLYILVYLAPTRALEPQEVREEIYKRECRRLNVIPLRSYLRNPIRNTLAVPYCGLGPRGAMALAAPLMVLFKNLTLQNTGMNKRSRSCSEIISLIKVKLFISFRHIKTVLKQNYDLSSSHILNLDILFSKTLIFKITQRMALKDTPLHVCKKYCYPYLGSFIFLKRNIKLFRHIFLYCIRSLISKSKR